MTMAETIIDLAQAFMRSNGGHTELITEVPIEAISGESQSKVVVALKFMRLAPVTRFRAIVEEWYYNRIYREIY